MMTSALLPVLVAVLLAAGSVRASEGDESCGCAAARLGFTINCDANAFIMHAYDAAMACTSCAVDSECRRNYLIVQAHHDHCGHHDLPTAIEVGFHDLEVLCGEGCAVTQQFEVGLASCPSVDCQDQTLATTAVNAANAACALNCTSPECVSNFHLLVAYHDTCEHHHVPTALSDALHDLEDSCAVVGCNIAAGPFDANTCATDITTPAPLPTVNVAARMDHGRLLATSSSDKSVHVYDVDAGTWMMLPAREGVQVGARLPRATADGRYAILTARASDRLFFVDTGLHTIPVPSPDASKPHSPPLVARSAAHYELADIVSESPGHVETHNGWAVVFFDGSLYTAHDHPDYRPAFAVAIPEAQLDSFATMETARVVFTDHSHHGNAWPTAQCRFVHSAYETGAVLPATFRVVDRSGSVLQTFSNACRNYHGFGVAGKYEIAGCGAATDGVGGGHMMALSYNAATDSHDLHQLTYPHSNRRCGTVYPVPGTDYAIGNYGSRGLGYGSVIRVAPSTGRIDPVRDVLHFPAQAWAPGATRSTCGMGMQQVAPGRLVTLLPDGYLYIYSTSDFTAAPLRVDVFPEVRAALSPPQYSCSGILDSTLEVGARVAIVFRPGIAANATLLVVSLDDGSVEHVTAPTDLASGGISDLLLVEPGLKDHHAHAEAMSCYAAGSTPQDEEEAGDGTLGSSALGGSGGRSSSDNDQYGLATLILVIVSLILIVVGVVVVSVMSHRSNVYPTTTVKFDNPLHDA